MRVERTSDGRVEVWLEDDPEDEPDQAADLSFTLEQMNALVLAYIRSYAPQEHTEP